MKRAQDTKNLRAQVLALVKAWRWKEAHTTANKLTEESKDDADAWVFRGYAAVLAGDSNDAVASFARALEIDRNADVPDYIRAPANH